MRISDWSSDVCSSDLGEIGPLHRVRIGGVEAGDASDRGFEMVEAAFLDEGGKLGAEAGGAGRLVHDDAATGLLHRGFDGLDVDRDDGAKVDEDRKSTRLNSSH